MKRTAQRNLPALLSLLLVAGVGLGALAAPLPADPPASFFPAWVQSAKYNRPLSVLDTDGALGRRNLHPKDLSLRDLALVHGHLCDGMVAAWVELGVALRTLFPDGIVDRTDLRAVSKNGACWVDTVAWTTGARINHGTLMLDNSVGNGFIVQRLSTGVAVRVSLKPGVFPAELASLEDSIRSRRASQQAVLPADIDRVEELATSFSQKLLATPPEALVVVETLSAFSFPKTSKDPVAARGDIINRDIPRTKAPHEMR